MSCFCFLFFPPSTSDSPLTSSHPEPLRLERDSHRPGVQDVGPPDAEAHRGVEAVLSHQPKSQGSPGREDGGLRLGGRLAGGRRGPRR